MTLNQKKLRIITIIFPVIILLISLTQDALTYEYQGIQKHSAISVFFMGGMAVLGGGILEWLIWLANPIAIMAGIRFLKETNPIIKIEPVLLIPIPNPRPISHWLSFVAMVIAWSFTLWGNILAAESGASGKIISLGTGYWLWCSSISSLCIFINLFYLLQKVAEKKI